MSMKEALELFVDKKIDVLMTGQTQAQCGTLTEVCIDWFVMQTNNSKQYFDITKTVTFWEHKE